MLVYTHGQPDLLSISTGNKLKGSFVFVAFVLMEWVEVPLEMVLKA